MSEVTWSEDLSSTYRAIARYAVPERERQVRLAVELVAASTAPGDVLDLCCGEGELAAAVHTALPEVRLLAYDGSASMLEVVRARLADAEVVTLDLAATDWRRFAAPLRAVVSSLAVHHIDGEAKRALFADLSRALAPDGVFVLADMVRPARSVGHRVAGWMWDEEVRRRALALDGDEGGFERFRAADWNNFHRGEFDPVDQPSTLVEHVDLLRAAGFVDVDLHWMVAGQMLLSAWKPKD
jgi:tRNA (cmo5U34)-methyltransferase